MIFETLDITMLTFLLPNDMAISLTSFMNHSKLHRLAHIPWFYKNEFLFHFSLN